MSAATRCDSGPPGWPTASRSSARLRLELGEVVVAARASARAARRWRAGPPPASRRALGQQPLDSACSATMRLERVGRAATCRTLTRRQAERLRTADRAAPARAAISSAARRVGGSLRSSSSSGTPSAAATGGAATAWARACRSRASRPGDGARPTRRRGRRASCPRCVRRCRIRRPSDERVEASVIARRSCVMCPRSSRWPSASCHRKTENSDSSSRLSAMRRSDDCTSGRPAECGRQPQTAREGTQRTTSDAPMSPTRPGDQTQTAAELAASSGPPTRAGTGVDARLHRRGRHRAARLGPRGAHARPARRREAVEAPAHRGRTGAARSAR